MSRQTIPCRLYVIWGRRIHCDHFKSHGKQIMNDGQDGVLLVYKERVFLGGEVGFWYHVTVVGLKMPAALQ